MNGEYLYYFLKSNEENIAKLGTGSTFKAITQTILKNIEIPLPLLDDQKRIAHVLGKVEGLIARRRYHLQQLDELLKSIFLEMFGDPVLNEMGWERLPIKKLGDISTGNTPPRKDKTNYATKYIEWIKTNNISSDSMYITEAVEHLSESGAKKGRIVSDGALLVACIAGSFESIGRAALTNRDIAFNQQINAIQPTKDVNSIFLYVLFKIARSYVRSYATKGMKKILTKGDFIKIKMIKPPLPLQNQFATIVQKVEGIKTLYQQSLNDLENLYGALSQKAFKGELDLSRIPLTTEGTESTGVEEIEREEEQTMMESFELPAPDDLSGLTSAKERQAMLESWLESYLEQLDGEAFTADRFMQLAQLKMDELIEDEPPELGVEEYDQLKAWVFKALDKGRLSQSYDDANNLVQLKTARS